MGDLLPLTTLRNVKDLTLRLDHFSLEAQWPDSWNQLTSMTRLDLDCQIGGYESGLRVLPPLRIKSLIEVRVMTHFESFESSGEEYLFFLIGCLPVLSRLQITVGGVIYPTNDVSEKNSHSKIEEGIESLKAICTAVQLRTSGMEYAILLMFQGAPTRNEIVTSVDAADLVRESVTLKS